MSKRSDPLDSAARPDSEAVGRHASEQGSEQSSASDKEPLAALRASWQKNEANSKQNDVAGGSASAGLSASVLPRTCCPSCLTVFEVSPDLLAAYDTRVRCGECRGIFDALINLRRDEVVDDSGDFFIDDKGGKRDPELAYVKATTDSSSERASDTADEAHDETALLDATHADFDLYSGEAELPEVAYFDQTLGHQELRLDETRNDESFNETMFVRDIAEHANVEEVTSDQALADLSMVDQSLADEAAADQAIIDQAMDQLRNQPVSDRVPADPMTPAIPLDASVNYITDDSSEEPLAFVYDKPGGNDRQAVGQAVVDKGGSGARRTEARREQIPSIQNSPTRKRRPAKPGFWKTLSRSWLVRSIMLFIVLAIALSLYAYRERDALLQSKAFRPVLNGVCFVMGCKLSALVDLDAIKLVKRSVFSHPSIDDALVIDLGFINEAEFDQPYPLLEIRLTDNRGGIVKQNNVPPSEYLQQWQPESVLAAGERIDLSLTVEDPGQTATSFELKFR